MPAAVPTLRHESAISFAIRKLVPVGLHRGKNPLDPENRSLNISDLTACLVNLLCLLFLFLFPVFLWIMGGSGIIDLLFII